MKKIISILLTVVMIFSFVSVGITAYAKDKNVAKENTYIASQSTYLNGYGQVYAKGEYKTPDESNPNLYVFVVSLVYIDADGKEVVIHSTTNIETGLRKVGAILADGADVGCGCVLNPGTVIGKNTSVYPLNAIRGVFAADSIIKSQNNVVERRK